MTTIDLPLFPLGQVVLAPTMPLPLHIFEARYREMIATCLNGDRRFGVVLIREGSEVGETASPHDVGTIAEITAASKLEDGRLAIWTEGRERFRIMDRYYDRAYLHATVEVLEEPVGLVENAVPLARDVRLLVSEYLGLVLKLEGEEQGEVGFPDGPTELSYAVLSTLQVLYREKQLLLEAATTEERLRVEEVILKREVLILRRMLELPRHSGQMFNLN